jgi:hypothetical protein
MKFSQMLLFSHLIVSSTGNAHICIEVKLTRI